jgi:chromosome segregation ATPase
MFFGLGMEKELKAQKKRFDAIHTEFIDVEWRGNLKKLKKSFSSVWEENSQISNLERKIREGRKLTDDLNKRFYSSKSKLDDFEQELEIIVKNIGECELMLRAIVTDLTTKQALISAQKSKG